MVNALTLIAFLNIPFAPPSSLPAWAAERDWTESADAPFVRLQREVDLASKDTSFVSNSPWEHRFNRAWAKFQDSASDPNALFEASACYMVASMLDPGFGARDEGGKKHFALRRAWLDFKRRTGSRLFTRRGYMFMSGDFDVRSFGDLGLRLLRADPLDRGVVMSMARELRFRG